MTARLLHDAYCNARRRGSSELPEQQPGEWAGEGYCRQKAGWGTAHVGSGRCKLHGGATPRGYVLPHTTHGRYSKDLPTKLAERYRVAEQDTALYELRDEIQLIDARLGELVDRLNTGETIDAWERLQIARQIYLDARNDEDIPRQNQAIASILGIVEHGGSEYFAWREILDYIERRRKLVESERKRLVQLQQMISTERLLGRVGYIVDVIRRHVHDRDVIRRISDEIRRSVTGD